MVITQRKWGKNTSLNIGISKVNKVTVERTKNHEFLPKPYHQEPGNRPSARDFPVPAHLSLQCHHNRVLETRYLEQTFNPQTPEAQDQDATLWYRPSWCN